MFRLVILHLFLITNNDFFNKTEVRFWNNKKSPSLQDINEEGTYRKTHKLSDDNTVTKKPIDEFLENPTEKNALKYLKWQQQRLAKLSKAVQILRDVRGKVITSEVSRNKSKKKAFDVKPVK